MGGSPHQDCDPRWMTLPVQITGSRGRDSRVEKLECWRETFRGLVVENHTGGQKIRTENE